MDRVVGVVVLALAASGFTALASIAQRQAARPAPGELSFSWRLASYLLHRPIWFLGIASMILGFVFQVAALRLGSLSLVQPLIATELVIVFGTIAVPRPVSSAVDVTGPRPSAWSLVSVPFWPWPDPRTDITRHRLRCGYWPECQPLP